MRDEVESVIGSVEELSNALRTSASTVDEPLATLATETANSSRTELPTAIKLARQAVEDSGTAASDLDEAASALRSYLDGVF